MRAVLLIIFQNGIFFLIQLQKQTVMSTQKGLCVLCHCFTQDSFSLTETIYCILCNRSSPDCQDAGYWSYAVQELLGVIFAFILI